MQTSKKYTLDWKDVTKGLAVAVLSSVLPIVIESFKDHHFDWWLIGEVAVSALSGYLIKNFLTPEKKVFD